jgi:adenine-specific DNA-methyltransferase
MGNACRNNVGGWPVHVVEAAGRRGFEYYALKDAEMAREADCGLMIWDGKSKGTLLNVHRLIEFGKPVVVYFSPSRECRTIKTQADLRVLLSQCPQSERRRLSGLLELGPEQATLFPAMAHALPKQQM